MAETTNIGTDFLFSMSKKLGHSSDFMKMAHLGFTRSINLLAFESVSRGI